MARVDPLNPVGPRRLGDAPPTRVWLLNTLLVILIVALDWLTPAGTVVGMLLAVPIVATSAASSPRVTWVAFGTATLGFMVAAIFGRGPISPAEVWIPNRVFALLLLPASCALALYLQHRRREIERARDEAHRASEVNRLLVSLVAHDLRAPLATAIQAIQYALGAVAPEADASILRDVDVRLRRNLGSIDGTLRFFRAEGDPGAAIATIIDVGAEIEAEVEAYREEAAVQGKPVGLDVAASARVPSRADPLLIRSVVGIVLDNAIRHARAGPIDVSLNLARGRISLAVTDAGPKRLPHDRSGPGAGLGLELCRALLARAGGGMSVTSTIDGRTRTLLRLPVENASARASTG